MGSEVFRQQEAHIRAELPEETVVLLRRLGMPEGTLGECRATPTLRTRIERVSQAELVNSEVDAVKLLEPFLGNPIFFGALRIMDLLNGCGNQCDTCYIDAVAPSRMLSRVSMERLWLMPEFRAMLAPDSFRYGSSGDVLNHPNGVEIVEATLRSVADFPLFAGYKRGELVTAPYRLSVLTNYRPNIERQLERLLRLTVRYPERLHLTVSLPLNLSDEINQRFDQFVVRHPEHFGSGFKPGKDGLVHHIGDKARENIAIMDVRHPYRLGVFGRVIEESLLAEKVDRGEWVFAAGYGSWEKGLVKIYFNAEGLWLDVYVSTEESHTARAFILLTPDNAGFLCNLPFHYDFPTPPNWTGGRGIKNDEYLGKGSEGRQKLKEMTVVGKRIGSGY